MAAYVPHNWESNEVISATLLNHIEDGIEELNDAKEGMAGKYTKPAGGIPKSDLASDVRDSLGKADTAIQEADIDETVSDWLDENLPDKMSGKADKADTVLDTTLSRGRKANTTVGAGSIAFGDNAEASGNYAAAFGAYTEASGTNAFAAGTQSAARGYASSAVGSIAVASGTYSHAEGNQTRASGNGGSHAEGHMCHADGSSSHAEGSVTVASGHSGSHAEGSATTASGYTSHAEGNQTIANSKYQHVFGSYNIADTNTDVAAKGNYIEIVGNGTGANARSNARTLDWDGNETLAGKLTLGAGPSEEMDAATKGMVDGKADKTDTVLETTLSRDRKPNTVSGEGSIAFGHGGEASGNYSRAYGLSTKASGYQSKASGFYTIANGFMMQADGRYNVPDTIYPDWVAGTSYAVGDKVVYGFNGYICTTANNSTTFRVEEWDRIPYTSDEKTAYAIGNGENGSSRSNAMRVGYDGEMEIAGDMTIHAGSPDEKKVGEAIEEIGNGKADKADTVLETTLSRGRVENSSVGNGSFAFGNDVQAVGDYSHAEGDSTTSNGDNSHAEGSDCIADGAASHAEGIGCSTAEEAAHAEGYQTIASNYAAHSEGTLTVASGDSSHAEGVRTTANHIGQHVFGINNIVDDSNTAQGTYVEIVGNGDPNNDTPKSNARTLDWNGNERLAGDVTAYAGGEDEISLIQLRNIKAPAILESASGNIVSIKDGADGLPLQECTVQMEPEQDLHGYDAPWPAGGGKNLLDESTVAAGSINTNGNKTSWGDAAYRCIYQYPLKAGTYTFSTDLESCFIIRTFINGTNQNIGQETDHTTFTLEQDGMISIAFRRNDSAEITQELHCQIEAGSDVTDYVPYSNICPISGWTGAKIVRSRKNLLGGEMLRDCILASIGGATHDPVARTVTFKSSGARIMPVTSACGLTNRFKADTRYTIIMTLSKNTGNGSNLRYYYTDGTYGTIAGVGTIGQKETHATVTAAGKTLTAIRNFYSSGTTTIYYDECGIFEGVLTENDFVPWEGESFDIQFPTDAGMVYGGSLDIHPDGTGTLISEYDYGETGADGKILRFGTESSSAWTGNISTNSRYIFCSANVSNEGVINDSEICNIYPHGGQTATGDKTIRVYRSSGNSRIRIIDSSIPGWDEAESQAELVTAVTNHFASLYAQGIKLQVIWKLTTPRTYELTAGQVKTILGENNIWADCGEIGIQYAADTKLYIDQKIMEAVAAALNA